MTIATIRKYTDEDASRVRAAAERFCARHDISYDADDWPSAETAIEFWLYGAHPEEAAYRRKLWTAVYCRALRVPCDVRTTLGWGYIGVRVD